MGVCFAPVFEKEIPQADAFSKLTDGKDVLRSIDLLEDICEDKGLTPFMTFMPYDEESIEEAIEELAEGEKLPNVWFDSADGLRMVSGLVKALKSEKRWAKWLTVRGSTGRQSCFWTRTKIDSRAALCCPVTTRRSELCFPGCERNDGSQFQIEPDGRHPTLLMPLTKQ